MIIGAALEVHNELKSGLLESVYREALAMELKKLGVESFAEQEIPIYYKGDLMVQKYRMDMVVGDVIVELKVASEIGSAHRAQLCNYMRLTKKPVGLLINFGESSLRGERWSYDDETGECCLLDKEMKKKFTSRRITNIK